MTGDLKLQMQSQRNYAKNLESFKKIKLAEKKSAEAKQKEMGGELYLTIVTGIMQLQSQVKEEEKLDISKSQNISEISLNEDH